MASLPGIRAGNAGAISRHALIERMEETAASQVYEWEVRRRVVAEELERTRREIAVRRVRIPLSPDAEHRRFGDLPAAIELRIAFSEAEELAAELVELSQAMAHDWGGFVRVGDD